MGIKASSFVACVVVRGKPSRMNDEQGVLEVWDGTCVSAGEAVQRNGSLSSDEASPTAEELAERV